jgi:hypothetical protein
MDGKTVRRSHDTWNEKPAIHLVSAWASATGFVLAQTKVDDTSNEITAIPEVLRCLAIRRVCGDAGCHGLPASDC